MNKGCKSQGSSFPTAKFDRVQISVDDDETLKDESREHSNKPFITQYFYITVWVSFVIQRIIVLFKISPKRQKLFKKYK